MKIVLTKNILNVGLSNSAIGIVKELFYNANKPAPALSKLVFVDFNVEYTGEMFFPNNKSRKGYFPIYPLQNKCFTLSRRSNEGYIENTHTMLPLKLYWT